MFDRIRNWLLSTAEYEAKLESNNFIENVVIERESNGENSHVLSIEFKQPVRDGNELSQLNIRNKNGTVVREWPLRTGETGLIIPINPTNTYLDCVAVRDDETVDSTDRINLHEL